MMKSGGHLRGPVIEVHSVSKSHRHTRAVADVTFDVQRGEVFGLVGPNGAGKTTLLHVIAGILKADAGRVQILGRDVGPDKLEVRRHVGLVPQVPAIYQELSPLENLRFFGGLYGIDRLLLRRRAEQLLELCGLMSRANDRVQTFSWGMKRKLNFAVGILHEPEVLLLDEPTLGVDVQSRGQMLGWIRDSAAEGRTILYTTHHENEVKSVCHRVALLQEGRMVGTGRVSELFAGAGKEAF